MELESVVGFLRNVGVVHPIDSVEGDLLDTLLLLTMNFFEYICRFVINFPVLWRFYSDGQNTRMFLTLEKILLNPSAYFTYITVHPYFMPLVDFAQACVSIFRLGQIHKHRKPVEIPSLMLLKMIPLGGGARIPTWAEFSLALNEMNRLGSLLYVDSGRRLAMGEPRIIALAMAYHPRLGNGSLLRILGMENFIEIAEKSLVGFDLRE